MSSSTSRAWPLAAALLLAAPARAEDGSGGVTPGPFRVEPAGRAAIASTRITLADDRVAVAFAITARRDATIRLDLPRFAWLGEAEPYPDRQFPELEVEVDGRKVATRDDVSVTLRGRDITTGVRQAGLDPFAIAGTPPFVSAMPGGQAAFDALFASGTVTRAPEGFLAGWTAARSVRVTPDAGRHAVTFRYAARPAFALRSAAATGVRWADYCITPIAGVRAMARRGLRGTVLVRENVIPAAPTGVVPPLPTLHVARDDAALTIVCDARGAAAIDPPGGTSVRPDARGVVRVLRISRPG